MVNHQLIKFFIVFFTGLIVTAIFYRAQLFSYGGLDFGDQFDGLIAFSIFQHWYNVFHHLEHWQSIGYFYPYKNTLGYNDGYFLYGVIYTILRILKIKMFFALESVGVIIRLIGFYAFFYLCYKQLNLKFAVCLLTAAIFSLSNAVYIHAYHTQLLSVAFAPLLTIFVINYFNHLFITQNIYRGIFWGSVAGIFYSAWLLSAYYMAWFYTLFFFIFIFFMILGPIYHHRLNIKKPPVIAIFIPTVLTLCALIPFLMTYLPIAKATGMHDYHNALVYMPKMIDLVNLGDHNLLWGKIVTIFQTRPGFEFGCPLILLGILFLAMIYSIKSTREDVIVLYRPLTYALIVSFLVTTMMFGQSFWYFIWKFFPGAKGLQVISRYWIFLVFPMCILVSYYLSQRMLKMRPVIFVLMGILLILEQINTSKVAGLNIIAQQNFINSIKAFPNQCQSFFVTGSRNGEMPVNFSDYINNVDAMLIAEIIGLRTINGFSTFNPPERNFGYYPKDTYIFRVKHYAKIHNISTLCQFDLEQMNWKVLNI